MKLAILMTTYQRPDGKTPFFLKRALDSVFAQTYKDFKVYLFGDLYEDNQEFLDIASSYPQSYIHYENLPAAVERERYVNELKFVLWCACGTAAHLYGIDKILKDGYDYICHLDHDDYWSPEHLYLISETIEETNADWLCTKAIYSSNGEFPFGFNEREEKLISFLPLPQGVTHSAVCCNYKKIPIRSRDTFQELGEAIPGDLDLWRRMAEYITEHDLKSLLINIQTCFHMEEGCTFNG
jgi:glycosyltransferase involved in cell wall biosynthesis